MEWGFSLASFASGEKAKEDVRGLGRRKIWKEVEKGLKGTSAMSKNGLVKRNASWPVVGDFVTTVEDVRKW